MSYRFRFTVTLIAARPCPNAEDHRHRLHSVTAGTHRTSQAIGHALHALAEKMVVTAAASSALGTAGCECPETSVGTELAPGI